MLRIRLSTSQTELFHFFLSGFGVAVAAALTGVVSSSLWSLATLLHGILGAAIVALAATIAKASTPSSPPSSGSGPAAMLLLGALVGGGILAMGCSTPAAEGASITVMAAGDTARVFAHWPAVNRATGYTYTLTTVATNGTWTALPTGATTTTTSVAVLPVSTNSDSAVFQLCVTAAGPAGSSPVGCTASTANAANTWHRKLGTPQPVFDSVTALILLPADTTLAIGAHLVLCPFYEMGNGAIVMRSSDAPSCAARYQANYSIAQRTVTVDQQMIVDASCLSWHNANPAVGSLTVGGCDLLGLVRPRIPAPHLPADALAVLPMRRT